MTYPRFNGDKTMATNAYEELLVRLAEDGVIEAIVIGEFGWNGHGEPKPPPVPHDKRGKAMSLEEAAPYMQDWRFFNGFGAPESYAAYIWTDQRVYWVTQYDGATTLDYAPRHPCDVMPYMPGG